MDKWGGWSASFTLWAIIEIPSTPFKIMCRIIEYSIWVMEILVGQTAKLSCTGLWNHGFKSTCIICKIANHCADFPLVYLTLIFEKSSWKNQVLRTWFFVYFLYEPDFLSISNLIFAGYTVSKNQVRNRQKTKFVQLDFSKI